MDVKNIVAKTSAEAIMSAATTELPSPAIASKVTTRLTITPAARNTANHTTL